MIMKSRERGFTLIEVLIGLVIMSIVILAVLEIFSKGQGYFINQNAQADILEDTRYPMAWIARDVKTAVGVAATWGSYASSADALILQVPSVDANALIIDISAHFDYIVYHLSNGKLQRIYDGKAGVSARPDSSRYLGDNVTAVAVTYYDDDDTVLSSGFASAAAVRLSIASTLKGFQRTYTENMNSKFKLRNKGSVS